MSDKDTDTNKDPQSEGPDLRKQLESTLADLKSMAGELGEKLGKGAAEASSEAKERWKKVEPKVKEKLQAADKEISDVSDAAAEQLKGLFGELKGLFGEIRSKVHGDADKGSEKADDDEPKN